MDTDDAVTAAELIARLRPERIRDLEVVRQLAVETPLIEITDKLPNRNQVWLKLESAQPVRSFKIRGATYASRPSLTICAVGGWWQTAVATTLRPLRLRARGL